MRTIPELDGLRAVAVIAVLLFHSAPHGPFQGGFIGVDLFFVLSGYLITRILAEEARSGGVDVWRFYRRRFFRLMPALLFMLTGYLLAAPFIWPDYQHGRDGLVAALYLSDYGYALWQVPFYLQHTWSLAVEEHFYLLWPLAIGPLVASRRPVIWLSLAWLATTLWRYSSSDWTSYYYRFDTHCSGLLLGAILAFLPSIRLPRFASVSAALALLLLSIAANITLAAAFITFAEIAAAVLIVAPLPVLRLPVLQTLGRWSYAIYLWHFPIAYAVRDSLGFTASAIVTLVLSIGVAALSWTTVEAWGRNLRDRSELARIPGARGQHA